MASKMGGSFATLILAVVLAAVPLMAIFGIPKLTDLNLNPKTQNSDPLLFANSQQANSQHSFNTPQNSNGFTKTHSAAPQWNANSNPSNSAQPASAQPVSYSPNKTPSTGSRNNPFAPPVSRANASEPPRAFGNSTAVNSTASLELGQPKSLPQKQPRTQFTTNSNNENFKNKMPELQSPLTQKKGVPKNLSWQDAIAQLNTYGIQNYRLEAGSRSGQFLFVCFYQPKENPQMTIRFEAEASEPISAVMDVLSQIQKTLPQY